jgi:hypothetical protein
MKEEKMCKAKVLKLFLIVFAIAAFIGGTMANVEAGSPLGVYCWDLLYPDGTTEEIELAINLDAPPGFSHMSALGVWHRTHDQHGEPTTIDMCVPVHGTAQLDRQNPEQYEIALSYEDIIQNPPVQGHFHALVDIFSLAGPFAYNDEPVPGLIVFGLTMKPRPCPINCRPPGQ